MGELSRTRNGRAESGHHAVSRDCDRRGIVLAECNRHFMREKGIVIYLCAPVSALVGRLEAFPEEGQRPALTSRPLSEEVSEVLAERDALYREAAHHVVDASAAPEEVVIQIITALRLACAS